MGHKNLRGRQSIIESDQILKDFIISAFMDGNSSTEISRMIKVRFPTKPINRLTISRYLDKMMDNVLDPEQQGTNSTKALLQNFDDTLKEFNDLFEDIRKNMDLTPEQNEKLDSSQRRITISINLSKKRWKMFLLTVQQSNTELKEGLGKFIRTLDGTQKLQLNEMLKDLWREDEILDSKDSKIFQRYQKQKTKLFYKYFPISADSPEVA